MRLLASASLAVCAMSAGGQAAKANITLTLHETGFADATVTGTSFATFSGTFGDFLVTLDTGSSVGSTPTDAKILTTTNSVTNVSTLNTPAVLEITVTQTFSAPATPVLKLTSSLSTTEIDAGDSIAFQSFLTSGGGGGNSTKVTLTGPTAFASTASPSTAITTFTTPYTLKNVTTITMAAGNSSNSTGRTDVLATPEPATMASAVIGLGLFGGLGYLRRRSRHA